MRMLCRIFAISLLAVLPAGAEDTPIKFTLDWKIQGVHGWFYLAQDKGYFAEQGLDVSIDQGEGSAATVSRIMSGAYDAGFGDMNAIIQNAALKPGQNPVMVYQIYNQPPFAVLTTADGPVKALSDLEGREIGGPPGSASTKLFPALAEAAGIDASKVEIINIAPNLQEQMLLQGQVAASLVFNVTSYMNLVAQKRDPAKDFRWFPYGESGLDIYSNGVMVSPKLLQENPRAVAGLVAAINRAVQDVIADPELAIAAVLKREALLNAEIERLRLGFAMDNLIVAPESLALGVGALDEQRLTRSIATIAKLYELPSQPDAASVFDASFLPDKAERGLK